MQFPLPPAGELYQRRLPEAVSRGQVDQTTQAGLHDTNFALDLCTIFQSKSIYNIELLLTIFNNIPVESIKTFK